LHGPPDDGGTGKSVAGPSGAVPPGEGKDLVVEKQVLDAFVVSGRRRSIVVDASTMPRPTTRYP
jgi:hypothetical protein